MTRPRYRALLLGIVFVAVLASTRSGAQQRDTPARPVGGNGAISGVVVSSIDRTTPIRRAVVKLSGPNEVARGAVTDDAGRFTISWLPEGRYSLRVSKPTFLTTEFGSKGAGRTGTTIVVRDGEPVPELTIPLTPGGVIGGTVRDHLGEPALGLSVFIVRAESALNTAQGADMRAGATLETVTTDDLGAYRFFGLAPGNYLVGALPASLGGGALGMAHLGVSQIDAELAALQAKTPRVSADVAGAIARVMFAPTFHPGTTAAENAGVIALAPGEDRQGIDVSLSLVPAVNVSGVVMGPTGPRSGVHLALQRVGPSLPFSMFAPTLIGPGSDGQFRFSNVIPGTYVLSAHQLRVDNLWSFTTITVGSADLSGVTLQLRPATQISGQIVFDASTQKPPQNLSGASVWLRPKRDRPLTGVNAALLGAVAAQGQAAANGEFDISIVPMGTYLVSVEGTGWWLRSVIADGRDWLDFPPEFDGRDISNVVVTLSDRRSDISGRLTDAAGKARPTYTVIVAPDDRALWPSARRVRETNPATDGGFVFSDLPAGTYRLAVVTDLPDNWRSADVLAPLLEHGLTVTLNEGEKKVQHLQIAR